MTVQRILRKAGSICLLAMAAACAPIAWAQSLTSKGTDFYATFTKSFHQFYLTAESLNLFISSTEAATGTIEFLATGTTQTFTTTPNQVLRIQAPTASELRTNMVVEKKAIHVVSDKPISLYGLSNTAASTDAFLAFPTATLGNS